MTEQEFKSLIEMLEENNEDLSGPYAEDEATLNLSGKEINDEEIKKITYAALNGNKFIKDWNLDNNKIGDEGAKSLAYALENSNRLANVTLNLNNNQIGDEGVKALVRALETNDHGMTYLSIYYNRIGAEGVKAIEQSSKGEIFDTLLFSDDFESHLESSVIKKMPKKNVLQVWISLLWRGLISLLTWVSIFLFLCFLYRILNEFIFAA
ncbi:MAG: hypothetical protein KA508_07135 [Gammaproteobacteria bacterium]|nr:hypothetical protein [Gammaproteobacteria bacterium]